MGSLMYAMICTRPDIAFAVGVVSHYMSNPRKKHWEAIKGLMRYLNGTKDLGVCFGGEDASVLGYTGLDYTGDMDKMRSTSGYVFLFTRGAISWRSHLQNCTTMSTTEVEYVAASEASKEAIRLSCLVSDFGISADTPTLHCDSQSAIMLAKNPVFHAKTKHISVKYHFSQDVLEDKHMQLMKILLRHFLQICWLQVMFFQIWWFCGALSAAAWCSGLENVLFGQAVLNVVWGSWNISVHRWLCFELTGYVSRSKDDKDQQASEEKTQRQNMDFVFEIQGCLCKEAEEEARRKSEAEARRKSGMPNWLLRGDQEIEEWNLGFESDPKMIKINKLLKKELKDKAWTLFLKFKDVFAWEHSDLKGVDLEFWLLIFVNWLILEAVLETDSKDSSDSIFRDSSGSVLYSKTVLVLNCSDSVVRDSSGSELVTDC
ncbi:hypothetical protein L7F22_036462 [Adiantum nelumboides]|nr:hypothetical protein [Adiantum nelumboides]